MTGGHHIVVEGTNLRRQCGELRGHVPCRGWRSSAFAAQVEPFSVCAERRALIFFGGFAPHAVKASWHPPRAELIDRLCGDERLREAEASGLCAKVEGLLAPNAVADYMRQALIGKPGPGSISR